MSVVLGLALLAVVAVAQAAENSPGHIQSCKTEVQKRFGIDTDVMVVNQRRIPSGIQVKLAARLDRDNTRFVNCWVPSLENDDGSYARGVDTFAARLAPATTLPPY
jgi:hypothetical protein